jgi:hypothetical protein
LYAATGSAIRLNQKDSVLTQATFLAQQQMEETVLTARHSNGFYAMASVPPVFVGDQNRFVCVETVTDLVTDPTLFGYHRIRRITVQISQALAGASTPTPAGHPLVQLSTAVTAL